VIEMLRCINWYTRKIFGSRKHGPHNNIDSGSLTAQRISLGDVGSSEKGPGVHAHVQLPNFIRT